MAIANSHISKKISADINENLQSFSKRLLEKSTYTVIDTIVVPIEDYPFLDKEIEVSVKPVYETLNLDLYKAKIEMEIMKNPSHLIDVRKTQVISLDKVVKKLNESFELYDKEWDEYRTQKAELLELYEDEENSE